MQVNKVLIPVSDSEFSLNVLPHLTRLLEPEKNQLYLLHVAPNPTGVKVDEQMVIYADQEAASLQAESRAALEPYVQSLEEMGFQVTPAVSFGDPAREIEHFVAEKEIDLVAMTTHGRKGLARVIRGSVAQHVATHVDIPVLLYRVFQEEGEDGAVGQ
jgi:nucleotide-binding universal stress UspA family protein